MQLYTTNASFERKITSLLSYSILYINIHIVEKDYNNTHTHTHMMSIWVWATKTIMLKKRVKTKKLLFHIFNGHSKL